MFHVPGSDGTWNMEPGTNKWQHLFESLESAKNYKYQHPFANYTDYKRV